jgi:hypothetical protein
MQPLGLLRIHHRAVYLAGVNEEQGFFAFTNDIFPFYRVFYKR